MDEPVTERGRGPRPRFLNAGSGHRADRASLVNDALDTALRYSKAAMGNVQLVDPEARGLRIAAQRGFSDPFLDYFEVVDDTTSACGQAMLKGKAVVVSDVASSAVFAGTEGREVMLQAGARAVQSVPLTGPGGEILGVFSLHYRTPDSVLSADRRLLTAVARRASLLLQADDA